MTEWDYDKTVGLKFKEGRPFSKAFSNDSNAVIINEMTAKTIGFREPVGKTLTLPTGKKGYKTLNIIGVIENDNLLASVVI